MVQAKKLGNDTIATDSYDFKAKLKELGNGAAVMADWHNGIAENDLTPVQKKAERFIKKNGKKRI